MNISKDLLFAILSMDSYNRGYNAGISDDGHTGLGDITISFLRPHQGGEG